MINHELLFRSEKIIRNRENKKILVLGLGALGSNLIPILIKNGYKLITGIDFDRIESHNIGNQFYTKQDIGRKKTIILKNKIYQELGLVINVIDSRIERINKFDNYDLIIDTFDNWNARLYAQESFKNSNLIHAGMNIDGFFEIKWDKNYHIPENSADLQDACEYPLACNLVYFTVSYLSEIINKFIDYDEKLNCNFTIKDLCHSILKS